MNVLSSILNFIADTIGNVSMGTTATTLKGAIAETFLRTRSVFTKATYTDALMYGVHGYMGANGYAYIMVPANLASNVSSVSITSFKCSIRTVSGTYLGGSGGAELVGDIDSQASVSRQPLIYVRLRNTNYGVTANTPLTGQVTMSFTLS